MISRLTTLAVTFAVLASASIALATTVSAPSVSATQPTAMGAPSARPVTVIELPRVTIVAKRLPA